MNIKDGYAMKAAVDSGYNVCIISGGSNEGVRVRLRNLGITDIHLGTNKVETLTNIPMCTTLSQNKYCMGDDIPDYHVMKLVGLPTCPQDASPNKRNFKIYFA
jgi:3-deoxy-D-manno-octulosonate 8-phosphate phosphatase (KDO 8-P phosphatase)